MPAPARAPDRSSAVVPSVAAAFLGWMLDAFDFFTLVFLLGVLARHFAVSKADVVLTITATLALRPVGAVVFGVLADRYGRRRPLIANILFFSVMELLCGFAPNFAVFFLLRALYGIGMGGEWGVGASLAMEAAPRHRRGLLSGVLQSGYPVGYLLAALAARFILPVWGWRAMFWLGGAPALLALYVRWRVPESEAWRRHRAPSAAAIVRTAVGDGKRLGYLLLLMTCMMFLSHGTQDLYPDFLSVAHHLGAATVANLAVLYNLGAIAGGIAFGLASERWGRRRGLWAGMALSLVVIPLWAYGGTIAALALGSFLMQAGVQGAWGIIPAHLNELAPGAARGLLPGLAYQLGILIAAPVGPVEFALGRHFGYAPAMAGFILVTILLGAAVVAFGPERRGADFLAAASAPSPPGQ
ncbi:MAG: MFS transporter [Terriglobales bacterium]